MTEKRFTHKKWYDDRELFDGDKPFAIVDMYTQAEAICDKLNELAEENKELKEELRIYRQVANCHNCAYHGYDWYDDGDEFEVCRKGNDVSEWICKDWEEL